ncbi:hypothetical protein L204_102571 [Cryptococcus depauperatus]|nr:hypothetical protein L204_00678 [Cryptococcus depauperatus CBS 7855]
MPLGPSGSRDSSSAQKVAKQGTSSRGDTPGRDNVVARLPERIATDSVWRGDLDARVLADMLSPREPSVASIKSRRSDKGAKSKASRKRRKADPDTAASTSSQGEPRRDVSETYRTASTCGGSSCSHSTASVTTENHVHPSTAQRATRQPHHLLANPSLSSLAGMVSMESPVGRDGQETVKKTLDLRDTSGSKPSSPVKPAHIARALANLPWAEPPPRTSSFNSPLASPVPSLIPSPLLPRPTSFHSGRQPTYSFLAEDPVDTGSLPISSRRSSVSSLSQGAHARKQNAETELAPSEGRNFERINVPERHALPADIPVSPSIFGFPLGVERPLSGWSAYSGMAVASINTSNIESPEDFIRPPPFHCSNSVHYEHEDGHSSTATHGSASQPSYQRSTRRPSLAQSGESFLSHAMSTLSARRSKSVKSTKSNYSKRGSNSTLGHVFAKRWEVRRYEELVDEDQKNSKGEEAMDLGSLVGRAIVLEKMLRRGRRVSQQSRRGYKVSRFSISTRNTSTPTQGSASISEGTHSVPRQPSLSRHESHSTQSHSRSNSLTPRSARQTPLPTRSSHLSNRKSKTRGSRSSTPVSLRWRLSKKLKRRSGEDSFTELYSQSDEEESGNEFELDASTFHPGITQTDTRPVSTATGSSNKTCKRSSQLSSSRDQNQERGKDRVGGKGVLVFPEELDLAPPPTPPKDDKQAPSTEGNKQLPDCTITSCFSLTSPFPNVNNDPEKGLLQQQAYCKEQVEEQIKFEQSPHLGHRSPHWRQRQSILSYISTATWDPVTGLPPLPSQCKRRRWILLGIVCGVIGIVLVVGLLAGLLSKQQVEG